MTERDKYDSVDVGRYRGIDDNPERTAADEMEALAIAVGTALNALIECVGQPMKSRTHYRWHRFPTFEEVQAAMEANNKLAEHLEVRTQSEKDRPNG